METARSFADRNTSRALGAQDFNSAEDALQLQRSAGEAELAEWRRTVEEFSQLANDAGEEFAALLPTRVSMFGINPCRMPPKNHRFYSPTVYKRMPT